MCDRVCVRKREIDTDRETDEQRRRKRERQRERAFNIAIFFTQNSESSIFIIFQYVLLLREKVWADHVCRVARNSIYGEE